MKITETRNGYRVQASTQRENPAIAAMVALLAMAPEITDDERHRHSELADGQTWRNWCEIPARIWSGPMAAMAGGLDN
ncbi:hypothetical protein Enr13x_12670 [Stieleria neptunia]|uniref:Uncharacterized protein n=1 Tax=Stieleria neptunia TaxID=2527979 RepID=A0A518HKR4_9BACT|nr:hypothetical protein [Stieleria neptunia]QDV41428.1 hypothetical protein Enr13x_12670 [Stieleria neptunia]